MCGHIFSSSHIVPETRSPHDLSNSIWHELSSPYTDSSDESVGETTTHVHEPFFEENSTQINVTTQLGSDVYLHCRVNDLREKMVSLPADAAPKSFLEGKWFRKSENEKSFHDVPLAPSRQLRVCHFQAIFEIKLRKPNRANLEKFYLLGSSLYLIQASRKLLKYQNKYPNHLLCQKRGV